MALFTNLRNAFYSLVPSWLSEGDGGKVLHALATLIDASVQLDRQRTELRFPRRAPPSANALTGVDRGIRAGRTETAAHYAERLVRWRYPRGHRVRGGAWALLDQVSEYFGGVRCATIDVNGNRFTRTKTGIEFYDAGIPWAWDFAPTSDWARFWIQIFSTPFGPITEQRVWFDPLLWTDGTIGLRGMTAQDAEAIRHLFTRSPNTVPWHPAGSRPEWVIVAFDNTGIVVTDPVYARWSYVVDSGLPDSKQEPVRDPTYRYFALDRAAHPYVEQDTEYVSKTRMPSGGTYAGDDSAAWGGVIFPDGTVHFDKVDPTFVVGVLLPDDASAVTAG